MRAGRLMNLLLLLQARGRVSATTLADEMEVSVRTVLRDIEALSVSGVPVRAVRGPAGGFELMQGWRTRLTGLTPIEAQAMFMTGASGPAAQLGLGEAAATAQLKLLAALPEGWQADAERVVSRFHLDAIGWYQREESLPHLAAVAQAVWNGRRLAMRYESWKGLVERKVEPLGLVVKAGEWYLVARADTPAPRTYRVSNIQAVEAGGAFKRPRRFDLAAYWQESLARFEAGLYRGTATLRASAKGLARARRLSAAVAAAVDAADGKADRQGWRRVVIPIESVDDAAIQLMKLGAECEVLDPPELRERIALEAERLSRLYAARRVRRVRQAIARSP